MANFDRIDHRILDALQHDAALSNADLADQVGLSANACWRRTRRLEEQGIIRKKVALLSQDRLNLKVTVFVGIKTNEHNDEWLQRFAGGVKAIPEVVEFYRRGGNANGALDPAVRSLDLTDDQAAALVAFLEALSEAAP